MQKRIGTDTEGVYGLTTTDEHPNHEAGCASVSHPGMTCGEAQAAWRAGKLPRTNGRVFRPGLLRKAT